MTATTDGNGFYSIAGLAGSLTLLATKDGFMSQTQSLTVTGDLTVDFTKTRTPPATFTLVKSPNSSQKCWKARGYGDRWWLHNHYQPQRSWPLLGISGVVTVSFSGPNLVSESLRVTVTADTITPDVVKGIVLPDEILERMSGLPVSSKVQFFDDRDTPGSSYYDGGVIVLRDSNNPVGIPQWNYRS